MSYVYRYKTVVKDDVVNSKRPISIGVVISFTITAPKLGYNKYNLWLNF